MPARLLFFCVLLSIGMALAGPGRLWAQQPMHGARAQVEAPHALGMGHTAVALPASASVFFYNPAHLAHLRQRRTPVVVIGGSGSFSPNAPGQLDFYNEELQPALARGLETMNEAERQTFFHDVLQRGRERTFASGTLLLPSFTMDRGIYGVGGGLFADSRFNYRIHEAAGGVPILDFISRTDFMAVASGAIDLADVGVPGLAVGLTSKYTQRYLVLKNKPLTELDTDENYHLLGSSALGIDIGLHWATPPDRPRGRLHAGAAAYDVLGNNFAYRFAGYYVKNAPGRDEATVAAEQQLAAERLDARRSYRVGLAYTSPPLGAWMEEAALTVEYLHDPARAIGPAPANHLRLGAQVTVNSTLAVRTGLNSTHPTFGVGLRFPLIQITYAYHHVQEAEWPAGWNHSMRIALGSF